MVGDRGASETLGAILMTVVAVTAVSVAAGAVFLADAPTDHPQAKISATYDGTNLTVEHRAGEALNTHESEIVLAGSGVHLDPANATELHGDGDAAFEPGEAWRFSLANGTKPGRVSLVYDRQKAVLVDSAVASEPGTPTVTTTTTDGQGSTTTSTTTTTTTTTTTETPTTTEPPGAPFSLEHFEVKDVSTANEVRVKATYRLSGRYDSVWVGLYRSDDEVVDWEPSWFESLFFDEPGSPVFLTDPGRDGGNYTVALYVESDGSWTRYERTIEAERKGNGNGGKGGTIPDIFDELRDLFDLFG